MNVAESLERMSRYFPDRTALVYREQRWSYRELSWQANRVGNALRGLGMGVGDTVCLLLPNGPEFVLAYFGLLRLGAVPVSLNVMLKPAEIAYIANDARAAAFIAHSTLLDNVPAPDELPTVRLRVAVGAAPEGFLPFARLLDGSTELRATDLEPGALAAILYTSGTTGRPKGAMLSHANVVSNMHAVAHHLRMSPDDRTLCFLPLFHCFGQNFILNATLNAGATLYLHERFVPDDALAALSRDQITLLYGVPTVYILLLNHPELRREALPALRISFSAAASLPREVAETWQERVGLPINEGYGLTESSPFASYNHEYRFKPGTVGTPIENVELKVVDLDGQEVPPGELGEIVIRGPNVMLGYFGKPEETAQALRGGWLHTGDIGRMDDEGYLAIVDRVKDMINVAGFKVWPREVEDVLFQHPAVRECAVIGAPDAVSGEVVKACVVLREGQQVTAEALIAFCRERIASYKVPRAVEFIPALPKSPTGKVLKRELRQRLAERVVPE